MDKAEKIKIKFKKILKRLKGLGIIKTYKLEINFCPIERNLIKCLIDIDSVLKKCLKKIIVKPKKAEIRNVINELVRKKNLNHLVMSKEQVSDSKVFLKKCTNENVTGEPLKFPCKFCEMILDSKKSFMAHKKLHIKSESYLCEKCGKVFFSNKKWQAHMNTYKGTGLCLPSKFCQNNVINEKQSANECVKPLTQNFKNDLTTCEIDTTKKMSQTLVQNLNVENNLKRATQDKKFICACGKAFRIWKTFKKHEKLKHSFLNTKYTCQICGKCFLEKGKLNRHTLSHKDSKYRCSLCAKLFARSDTLKRHLSMCHYISEEFCCSFCQKKFKLKYNRDVHEENIHKNGNHRIHCEHCGRKFRNKTSFKIHLKNHLKSRMRCTICSKSFSRKSYYENHVKNKHLSHEALCDNQDVFPRAVTADVPLR